MSVNRVNLDDLEANPGNLVPVSVAARMWDYIDAADDNSAP